ncbi:putative short chain oxidoreductase/dehydrogenase [Cadophora sp. DSE1049]|nr:putative short chain oxidoreductase/dehydrogenase [Cadophora sp. DSE1049]
MSLNKELPVWHITGCSGGFGYAIAKTALGHGPASSHQSGGHWIELDVMAPDIREKIEHASELFGRIDIVVNNAGYMMIGVFEGLAEYAARAQFEVNFFGPFKVMQAVIPGMRNRRSGLIINMSSGAGVRAQATVSMYSSSKFALEAMSESISYELAHFNVKILIVEPGPFRTTILGNTAASWTELGPGYKGTPVEETMRKMRKGDGQQVGDVWKGAERIFEVITTSGMGEGKKSLLRLPLGEAPVQALREKARHFQEVANEFEELALSTAI